MTESTPPEGGQQQPPPTRAQIFQLKRSIREQILNRAESDPEWRQLLIEDPELAMREANFPAAQQLAQQGVPQQEAQVTGQFYGQFSDKRWRTHRSVYKPLRDRDPLGGYGSPPSCRKWWFTF